MILSKKLLHAVFGLVILAILCLNSTLEAETDAVLLALSAKDFTSSRAQLEQISGSEDALVKKLLELRTTEKPPYVGIRAEKLLLTYAHREDVASALESDLQSQQYKGLARIIAINVDKVQDSAARKRLARTLINQGSVDQEFARYSRTLTESSDAEVSKMAKEMLK